MKKSNANLIVGLTAITVMIAIPFVAGYLSAPLPDNHWSRWPTIWAIIISEIIAFVFAFGGIAIAIEEKDKENKRDQQMRDNMAREARRSTNHGR